MEIRERPLPPGWEASFSTLPPLIGRLYAARGMANESEAHLRLKDLHSPALLGGIDHAAERIEKAIREHESIIISGDYDCDGATATTVAIRGLRLLGATRVGFTIPDRFKHGYGLTPGLIDDLPERPDLIITVDSGVASHAGVAHALAKGIDVIVTDHHLPGDTLPEGAVAIVDPSLKGDGFPSKALAGCGVMFYVLMRLRALQISLGRYDGLAVPDLSELVDIVAFGTVADLVPLDTNNRRLVRAGLNKLRQGKGHVGFMALMAVAGVDYQSLEASDIAFFLAPRINAAGRLENMRLGVELLLAEDEVKATAYAQALDAINRERRELQSTMVGEAETLIAQVPLEGTYTRVVYQPTWHAGVVGLVASKIKEAVHRPSIAFAPGEAGSHLLHGSARSIPGFHLRDGLARVDSRYPGLIVKFGGHAMAAGLTIREDDLDRFKAAFEESVKQSIDPAILDPVLWTDGPLAPEDFTVATAMAIANAGPWGQAFPEPAFDNVFRVLGRTLVGAGHAKLLLEVPSTHQQLEAMAFRAWKEEPFLLWVRLVYALELNVWNLRTTLQLRAEHLTYLTEAP